VADEAFAFAAVEVFDEGSFGALEAGEAPEVDGFTLDEKRLGAGLGVVVPGEEVEELVEVLPGFPGEDGGLSPFFSREV